MTQWQSDIQALYTAAAGRGGMNMTAYGGNTSASRTGSFISAGDKSQAIDTLHWLVPGLAGLLGGVAL